MAVTSVVEITDGMGGTYDLTKRTYTRAFLVRVDDLSDDASVVLTSGSVPQVRDVHGADTYAFCKQVTATRLDGLNFTVSAQYDTAVEEEEDPLDRDPVYSWGSETQQIPIDFDASGTPIKNSAKDPLDPTITRPYRKITLTITRNEASFSASLPLAFVNYTNTDTFYGASAGKALCRDITATSKTENDTDFWEVSYSFLFDANGHQVKVIDAGYRDSSQVPFLEKGVPVANPVPLNGSGARLSAGSNPVALTFTIYPSTAFSGMGL